jgi:S1-C subfamily serine protease/Flp pilus assembly protein TadD
MAAEWFYRAKGQELGPVDSREVRRLAEAGIVRPDTLVRQGTSGRWVHAERVLGLFQRSTPAPSPSLGASPPPPLPQPSPVPESGAPRRAVSGEGSIRHGVPAAAVNAAAEKPERIWPVTWVAIIVGSGTMLLLLWALVFRGGSAPQQEANKDQPRSVAAQPGKGTSAPAYAPQGNGKEVVWTPELGKSLGIPPPPGWQDKTTPAPDPAADSKSRPATGGVKVLELADLAELVGPSVVQVNVTGPEEAATGSGFVLDKQGTIVTNYHVIEDATAGRIIFSDKTSAPITGYLGAWPEKDIALVRVECPPDKLHPLRLATSAPRQGERVAAFGSPLGLQQSVSEGIVSAVRESKELRALGPIDVNALLIQTTTPISSGNSGGPLVDMKGMVVGINTWTFRPLGGENVNFAVAAVELPPLLLAKNGSPSPLPANAPGAAGVRRILHRAWAHLTASEYDRAIADYTEAIRLDPKSAGPYCGRGLAYGGKREYDRAIADYTEAIRLDPTYATAYCGRAEAYHAEGDYDSAIADCTEAIRLEPGNVWMYYVRGGYYDSNGDYDGAIADFTEVIRLDPKNAGAYHFRGLAYQAKGQRTAAERDFAQAKKLGYKPPAPVPPPGYKVWSPADTDIPPPPGRRSAPIVEEPQREVGERRAVVSAWGRLRLGMSPAQVQKLLGRANDIHTYPALGRMTWDYRYPDRISPYEGHIEFSQNGVSGWSEPREWAKD